MSDLLVSCLYACLRLHASTGDLKALLAIARDFSPRVRQAGEREVLLDVSGLGRLIGPPAEIARQLTRALLDANVPASAAIAPTQAIARVQAQAATGHGACARGPWTQLSVQLLQELEILPAGMNARDRARPYETLQRWGIATLGELAALPAPELSSRLGRRGLALQRLARGLDPAPFVPDGDTPRFTGRLELDWPIDALEPLSFVLARLLEPLSASLERADRGAAAVRLDLRLTDRSTHTRLLQLPVPMRDPRVLRTLLLLDLESHPPSMAVDVVGVELDPAPARITQFSLLQRALPTPETLSTLTARLSALAGESRVGTAVLLDTHEPGAFAMERYAPEAAEARARGALGASGARGAEVLRRQRVPPAIRVSVKRGRPVHIASSKRGLPYGAVEQAAGPWRTSGGWWAQPDSCRAQGKGPGDRHGNGPGAWNRDEWDVALSGGAVCRIFRDRSIERWFLEGIYD